MGLGPALGQVPWHEKLRRQLARRRGARLGEACVVSRQMHVGEVPTPHIVTIVMTDDAGQVFYGRTTPGEIIHLDIFHEVADVDHRQVAEALKLALAGVLPHHDQTGGTLLLDYFDLVTGTGGGRVMGDLNRGRKLSLRVAHRNHVHLAGLLPDDQLELLLLMVTAVEDAVRAQGVELRRVEKLQHAAWSNGAALDNSAYRDDNSDSWLGGTGGRQGSGRSAAAGGAEGEEGSGTGGQSLRSTRGASGSAGAPGSTGGAGGPGAAGAGAGGSGAAGAPGATAGPGSAGSPGEGTPDGQGLDGLSSRAAAGAAGRGAWSGAAGGEPGEYTGWGALADERRLQAALELSRRLGSPDEVKRVLDELAREQGWASLYGSGSSQAPFVVRQLEDEGLVRRDIRGLRLTEAGQELALYLDRHLRDVKLRFRKLIRRMPASTTAKKSRKPGPSKAPPSPDVRYGPIRGTAPAEPGAWLGDVAVPETVWSAMKRTHLERIESGALRMTGLRMERQDVHVYLRSGEQPLNICLLIDASASMAGRRILAAKHLARHLLVSTRDRIAVIAFQERDVRVYVPFTRDYAQVEEGLSRIQPMGLTPLAHGLTHSLDLIRESRVRRPLLLLITDGIPTVPKWTIDPLSDALEAARQVGHGRIPFGCIGLQPSKRYLEELARVAGGTLHVVEELDEDALITIAHRERHKIVQRVR
jgi:Mg-chelatase subunit ChlD